MKIPKRIRVGRKKYEIKIVRKLPRQLRGHWSSKGTILIGNRNAFNAHYTKKHKAEAFWHELTHAILHDMRHASWKNETFVTGFAKRLNDAIHSAEFE